MRLHGMSLIDACDLVVLDADEYLKSPPSHQSMIHYLPTPDEIEEMKLEIRAGRKHLPDPDFDLRDPGFEASDDSFWYG